VAGLRNALPTETFLFFLDGPYPLDPNAPPDPDEELAFGLAYHHLGVVRETAGGPQFAYPDGRSATGLLAGFASLEEVADAVALSE
jgi:hypothetical protein